jgi:NAD-dependent DNA ligase
MTPAKIRALVKQLEAAAYAYHNGLELTMTDEEYDNAIDLLRSAVPDHPFLEQVGAAKKTQESWSATSPLLVFSSWSAGSRIFLQTLT